MKKLGKNFIYNLIYQIFLLIVPFVVTPYVSRVLSPDGIGKYSFSYSIVQYFVIFGVLGFGYYAQREIAKCSGNKYKQSLVFWEINICRAVSTTISLSIYLLLLFLGVFQEYSTLMLILILNIVSTIFDETFLFQGNEEFGKIVIRNVIVKTIGIVLTFVFVKDESDINIYTIIQSSVAILSNLSLFFHLPKYVCFVKRKDMNIIRHIKPTLRLFIPQISTTIYSLLDKTIIGLITSSDVEVGYYEQIEKIIKMACVFTTCIGIVMIPRNSQELKKGNIENMKKNLYISFKFVFMLSIPICFGLIIVSDIFIPIYLGNEYEKCIILLQFFAPIVVLVGLTNSMGLIWMVPKGMDRRYSLSCLLGSIVNIILTMLLVYYFDSLGAVIASIISEFIILLTMIFLCKKEISFGKNLLECWKYFLSGLVMFLFLSVIKFYFANNIYTLILLIFIGIGVYGITLLLLKEQLIFLLINTIKKHLLNRKKI